MINATKKVTEESTEDKALCNRMEALLDKMENILGRVTEVEKKLDEKADVLTVSKLTERICEIEEHLKVTVPVSDESIHLLLLSWLLTHLLDSLGVYAVM